MSDHTRAYDLIREAFNAGRQLERDTMLENAHREEVPGAFDYIAPIAQKMEAYVLGAILAERESCALDAETWRGEGNGYDIAAYLRRRPAPFTAELDR